MYVRTYADWVIIYVEENSVVERMNEDKKYKFWTMIHLKIGLIIGTFKPCLPEAVQTLKCVY